MSHLLLYIFALMKQKIYYDKLTVACYIFDIRYAVTDIF